MFLYTSVFGALEDSRLNNHGRDTNENIIHLLKEGTMINEIGRAECPECYKEFDLTDPVENDEWYMGHDCEM